MAELIGSIFGFIFDFIVSLFLNTDKPKKKKDKEPIDQVKTQGRATRARD